MRSVDRTPINTAHTAQQSTIMRLAQADKAQARFAFHLCITKKEECCHLVSHVSSFVVFTCFFTTSTSSSSSTCSPTSQDHATHSVSREQFVDEKRYQRPFCLDQQQVGGIPRRITPTGYEPKALEMEDPEDLEPKRIEPDKSLQTDLYQLYHIQERFVEEDHQAPITEEVE